MPRRYKPCPICGELLAHTPECDVSKAATAQQHIAESYRSRDRLIRRCRKKGVSQQAIAEALGVSKRLVQLAEEN